MDNKPIPPEELQIIRDVEHAETEAADLIDLDPEKTYEYMELKIASLMNVAAKSGHPWHSLLAHITWLGWERAHRVWERRHREADSDT